jgi:hypothetical protein
MNLIPLTKLSSKKLKEIIIFCERVLASRVAVQSQPEASSAPGEDVDDDSPPWD